MQWYPSRLTRVTSTSSGPSPSSSSLRAAPTALQSPAKPPPNTKICFALRLWLLAMAYHELTDDECFDYQKHVSTKRTTPAVLFSETFRARGPRKPAGVPPACSLRSGRTRPQALRAAFLKPGGTGPPRLRRGS